MKFLKSDFILWFCRCYHH